GGLTGLRSWLRGNATGLVDRGTGAFGSPHVDEVFLAAGGEGRIHWRCRADTAQLAASDRGGLRAGWNTAGLVDRGTASRADPGTGEVGRALGREPGVDGRGRAEASLLLAGGSGLLLRLSLL